MPFENRSNNKKNDPKLKILQVNKFFFPKGGSEIYYFNLINLLEQKGHWVIPFSMYDDRNLKSEFEEYFVSHLDLSKPSGLQYLTRIPKVIYSREAAKKIDRLIVKVKPDVAHLHNIDRHITPSIVPAIKKRGIPIVVTLHDYKLICPNSTLFAHGAICEKCKGKKFYSAPLQKCIKNSLAVSLVGCLEAYIHQWLKLYQDVDLFLAPSHFLRAKFIEFGYPEEKIVYLPLFLEAIKDKSQSGRKEDYFFYFGRLSEEKGLKDLISVFINLPQAKLKIAGLGPQEKELKGLAQGRENIEFLGFQNKESLYKLVQKARAVIVPSIWYENAPLSVIESMSLGRVVIASRIGGMSELIEDRKTGLLFIPGDRKDLTEKVQHCLKNPNEAQLIGEKAKEAVGKKFSKEVHYNKLSEIYQSLIRQYFLS